MKKYNRVAFPFQPEKAQAAIDYILWCERGIEPVKLALLLFLADKAHVVRYGRPMFGGTWMATEAGPIHKEACESWLRLDSPWLPHGALRSWRRGIFAALALLFATVSPAAATPITFYGADGFLGPAVPWVVSGDAPVRAFTSYTNELVVVSGIVPYTRELNSFPFQVTWTLDDRPPIIDRRMMPNYDYGPADQYGSPTTFGVVATFSFFGAITDWGPHRLVLDLSVPDDSRRYAFDVVQPTPEPLTLGLLGGTLLVAGWVARRRRGR